MNIGIFTECYYPLLNGVVVSVDTYKEELIKLGHNVFIFAPSHPGHQEKDKNIYRFLSLRYPSPTGYRLPLPYPLEVFKKIRELNLDIIHTQSPFWMGQIAKYISLKFRCPLIFTFHTKYDEYTHYVPYLPQKILKEVVKKYITLFCNKCAAIVAPSTDIKNTLLKLDIKKDIFVIPTGVNLLEIESIPPIDIKKRYNIPDNHFILTFAGRLAREKNVHFLLEVFVKVLSYMRNVHFLIVGGGPQEEEIKNKIVQLQLTENITCTGMVSKKEVIAHLKSSDIFIFSSLTETQGLVILEAQAVGLPVVALDADGVREVIHHDHDGFLLEHKVDNFVEKVLQLLKDDNERQIISNKAKENARNFSSKQQAERLIDVYRKMTNLPFKIVGGPEGKCRVII